MKYYRHHIGDYRKDTGHLSLVEHGIYRQLIDYYYDQEGHIEYDTDRIMRLIGVRSDAEKEAFKNVVNDFFNVSKNKLIHKRCDSELLTIYEKSEKARQSAHARWQGAKHSECERNANAMRTACEVDANSMLPSNPVTHKPINPVAQTKSKTLALSRFDDFWKTYPKKKNKGTAKKAFTRLRLGNGLFVSVMEGLNKAKVSDEWQKNNGQYIPYPATWLNANGWEDEYADTAQVDYLAGLR